LNGGGVGEAVNGGEGEEAVDPWRVILNRPREAGEISKISRAVIACSTSLAYISRSEDGEVKMGTYRILSSRHAAAKRGLNFYRRLLSWCGQRLGMKGDVEVGQRLTRIHCIPPSTHPCAVNAYMPRRPIAHLPKHGYNVSRFRAQTTLESGLTSAPPPV
jgi:hypothetical protein